MTTTADPSSSSSSSSPASASKNEADPKKMFVGGLSWETSTEELKEYFTSFGEVVDATIKTDATGTSRGFGFVLFAEEASVEAVLAAGKLVLKEKKIEAKRAAVKEIKKIFVGGVDPKMPEEDIRAHFVQYGEIEAVELPVDKEKGGRRGFVFVTFATAEACDKAAGRGKAKQKIGENPVDVKKAVPQKPGGGGGAAGGGGMAGGYYPPGGYDPGYYGYYGGYGYPGYGMPAGGGRGRGFGRGRGRGAASAAYGAYQYDPYAGYDFSQDYGYGDSMGYGYPPMPMPGGGKMRGRGRGARGSAPY